MLAAKPDPDFEDDELFDAVDDGDSSSEEEGALAPLTAGGSSAAPRPSRTSSKTGILDLGLVLKMPRAAQYSTKTFYEMIKDGRIDLEPEYQRGVVWNELKQSAIIESIMRHYYVPPILLSAKEAKNEGDPEYICIDGKQRLSSVYRFMNNEIPVKEPATGRKYFYKERADDPRAKHLTLQQRRKFDNEQLTCVEFDGLMDEIERDMFSRVQMGVTLSSAEKLAAHLGPWPEFLRMLIKRYLDPVPGLSTDQYGNTIITVNRGKDYLFMAQITLLIHHAHIPRYIPTASQIDTFLKNHTSQPPTEEFKKTIFETMAKYVALANHELYGTCIKPGVTKKKNGLLMSKPLAPVEFVYVGYLISKYRHLDLSQLYQIVFQMKEEVRPQFKDMMFNTSVANVLRKFIDTATIPPPLGDGQEAPRATSTTGRKRVRVHDDEDDDPEWRPSRNRRSSDANGLFRGQFELEHAAANPLSNPAMHQPVNYGENFYGGSRMQQADLTARQRPYGGNNPYHH